MSDDIQSPEDFDSELTPLLGLVGCMKIIFLITPPM